MKCISPEQMWAYHANSLPLWIYHANKPFTMAHSALAVQGAAQQGCCILSGFAWLMSCHSQMSPDFLYSRKCPAGVGCLGA